MFSFELYKHDDQLIVMKSKEGKRLLDLATARDMHESLSKVLAVFDWQKEVGERVKEARIAAGLSVGQAARLLKVARESVENCEAGLDQTCDPSLHAFAELYAVDREWLLGRKNEDKVSDEWKEKLTVLPDEDRQKLLRLLAMTGGGE